MLCSEYAILASLLGTALHVTNDYTGSSSTHGTPTLLFHGPVGEGRLNITLPKELGMSSFLWNETDRNGIVVRNNESLNVLNITLLDYVYRLDLLLPSEIDFHFLWQNSTFHPAIHPLNISTRQSLPLAAILQDSTTLDLMVNSSLLDGAELVMSLAYEWSFAVQTPGLHSEDISVMLTPFDWSYKQLATNESYIAMSMNLTDDMFNLEVSPVDSNMVDLNDSCPVDGEVFETNGGLVNCSKCATLNYQYSLSTETDFDVVQHGASLFCSPSAVEPVQEYYSAGDVISYNFTIKHSYWSRENAENVTVEMRTGVHMDVRLMQAFVPDIDNNITMVTLQNKHGDVWTLDVSLLGVESPDLLIQVEAMLKDSLPLQDQLSTHLSYRWTYQSADGLVFNGTVRENHDTAPITVGGGDNYFSIPSQWNVGLSAEATTTLTIPPGTVDGVAVVIDLAYNDALMEVELVEYTITTSHPDVVVEVPLSRNYLQRRKRRDALGMKVKRALVNNLLRVNVGSVKNPLSTGGPASMTIAVKFRPTLGSSPLAAVTAQAAVHFAGMQMPIGATVYATIGKPALLITKQTKAVDNVTISVKITISHDVTSATAYKLMLTNEEKGFKIDGLSWPAMVGRSLVFRGEGGILLQVDEYNVTSGPIIITYQATSRGDAHVPSGSYNNTADLTWHSSPTTPSLGPQRSSSCITRKDVHSESFLYKHGITAAAVIIGFILGLVLVPLVIFLVVVVLKKTKGGFGASVRPSATDYRAISKQKGKTDLLLDAGQKLKEGFTSAMVAVDDSIVSILSLKDKFTTNRELDNLDILSTVEVDKRMEAERLRSMDDLLTSLLLSMMKNGDITKQQYEQVIMQVKKTNKEMDVKLKAEFTVAMTEFTQRQAVHNRSALGNMIDKQRADKAAQLEKVEGLNEEEKEELTKHIDTQCQIEQDDLSYRLKLEQDEEVEKLRKEFSLRKRIQTKEMHQNMLNDLKSKTKMEAEQAAWLLKEHAQNVSQLDKIHDDELCRQKLVLEEKLAKRRALAELSDLQEKGQSELLNSLAGGQMEILKKAKKQKILTAEEARNMSEDIMNELVTYKQSMEADVAKQEAELHKQLSELKKKKFAAKQKEHQAELDDFDKNCQLHETETRGTTLSPLAVAEERLQLVAKHEIDMAATEIEVDQENATKLRELRDQLSQKYKGKLLERESKLLETLKEDGMRDEQAEAILAEHNMNVENMEARQKQQYEQQDENLKIRLKKRRKDWEKRMKQEQTEKAHLREQEDAVVSQVIDSQITMSVEEREKILREHEKDMVRLENSLTLNKLQQRQKLEQKLSERRAKRMQQLQQSQLTAIKKTEKKHREDDEDEQQAAALELLKSQAEERVAILIEEDAETNFDEELEKVKLEMLQQRAVVLREQEDRLGSMVAQLQINKAKELTEIDEKQRAINELKANLIDDLSERGVMSDAEAEQCLEQHRAQQMKLTNKLNNERDKQEQMLKRKLADRLQAREKTLLDGYDDRLKEVLENAPNKVAAKLKKAAIMHKRKVAIEEFKARMEKEISQSLEEMRREHSVRKAKLTQELELRFIASLVRQGKLKRSEIKDCLKMLFPAKSDKQVEELINSLHDENESVTEDEKDLLNDSSASMLKERIARSVSMYRKESLGIIEEEQGGRRTRPKSKKKQKLPPLDYDPRSSLPPYDPRSSLPPLKSASRSRRPEPNAEYF